MDTKVLIIGAGHAGIETAASLRNLGFSNRPSPNHTSNHLRQKKLFLEVRNGMLIIKLI